MKIGTLMSNDKSSLTYKFVNNNRQFKLVNVVYVHNLLVLDPTTMKRGTLMFHDKSSLLFFGGITPIEKLAEKAK